ncbi:MAG TPA: hypothetical protein VJ063_12560, partial [Verrucomicrobiae bacterium]|nr:hypothetical protein [Verrucomicrobiae bacterium]
GKYEADMKQIPDTLALRQYRTIRGSPAPHDDKLVQLTFRRGAHVYAPHTARTDLSSETEAGSAEEQPAEG